MFLWESWKVVSVDGRSSRHARQQSQEAGCGQGGQSVPPLNVTRTPIAPSEKVRKKKKEKKRRRWRHGGTVGMAARGNRSRSECPPPPQSRPLSGFFLGALQSQDVSASQVASMTFTWTLREHA
ncbi:hypothetical protein CGRA01v4_10606 [Colletotrichum graminicola]|nr:hypothetical protein CGRA01v4_10606 [Colletotrichum graminicola]